MMWRVATILDEAYQVPPSRLHVLSSIILLRGIHRRWPRVGRPRAFHSIDTGALLRPMPCCMSGNSSSQVVPFGDKAWGSSGPYSGPSPIAAIIVNPNHHSPRGYDALLARHHMGNLWLKQVRRGFPAPSSFARLCQVRIDTRMTPLNRQIEEMSKDRVADAAPFTQKQLHIDEQLAKQMQVRYSVPDAPIFLTSDPPAPEMRAPFPVPSRPDS